jgi:hypothetical protein
MVPFLHFRVLLFGDFVAGVADTLVAVKTQSKLASLFSVLPGLTAALVCIGAWISSGMHP